MSHGGSAPACKEASTRRGGEGYLLEKIHLEEMGDQWRREASGCTAIPGRGRRGRRDRAARAFVEEGGRG